MILSDREIQAARTQEAITITDCPPPDDNRWASTILDLTLDAEIRVWEPIEGSGEDSTIDPMKPGFNVNKLIAKYTRAADCTRGFVIKRGQLVLGWTVEKLKLPYMSRLAARVEGKSSLARIGLGIHITAPTIHAGFGTKEDDPKYPGSPIRLEIWNMGPPEIRLTKGMAICQLIFEEVHGTPNKGYSGQFRVQGPEKGKKKKS